MIFTADLLKRLRAARGEVTPTPGAAQAEAPLKGAAPLPPRPAPPTGLLIKVPPHRPQPSERPSMAQRAQMLGHCGTCRAFTLTPDDRHMGECSHGREAFEPWARHSRVPVSVHEAARCMTLPFPHWVQRPGVHAAPDIDWPPWGKA